ncbi:PKD domain-containing protein [Litorilituus lipolyticus]|uniref:PKD domain-containing protein n=1 Tax=Litorilituus lipolyticus TaxID=2491017 RepID=A0A502L019_9GAMM|nr:PKD domain-containing protein [Litorilituus lipolyticus]TPH15591.1 PKD domain-containing protein [Litorilituus lipolyticus]
MPLQHKVPSLMALMLTVSSTAALAGDIHPIFKNKEASVSDLANKQQVCGTDKNKQDWDALQIENQLQLKKKLSKSMLKAAPQIQAAANGNGVDGRYYIPVVVHVYGDQYNCADESSYCLTENKIIDALNKSNEDFLGTNTQDGPIAAEFQAIRDNLNIEFVLAKKDPQGNPTNGIVRYANKSGYGNGSGHDAAIAADAWDNFKYMNIYLMSDLYADGDTSSSGVAWYPQMSMSEAGLSRVVYNGHYLGANTGENFRSVLTHEFGHWLNLPHTFDGDVCSVHQEAFCESTGDNNCDTPQMSSSILQDNALNCLGEPTNTENFMHYSDNYAMYTQGQVKRMTAALHGDARKTLWSNENLIAVGLEEYTSNSDRPWDGSGLDVAPSGEVLAQYTNLSATKGETDTFEFTFPEGTQAAAIYLKGYNQDPDLYVSKGVAPTKNGETWIADFISFKSAGTPELVTFTAPSTTQPYFATIDAFSDYSNATLEILSVEDPSLCTGCERVFLAEETNLSATKGDAIKSYSFDIPSDASRVVAVMPGGYLGDPDMYVSVDSIPTTSVSDCAPFSAPRLSEYCDLGANVGGKTVNVIIDPFLDYSGATFRVYYEREGTVDPGLPTAEANGGYSALINESITFSSAGSVDSDGTIVSYLWDFGDGNTSTQANPNHAYTASGTYSAVLTVTDNDNNQATDSSVVTIAAENVAPVVNVNGPYSGLENTTVTFSSAGTVDTDGSIASYSWSFGDGNTSTLANPSHVYSAADEYTVTLTVTDNDNASTTSSTTAVIAPVVNDYCTVTGNTGYEWIANVSAGGVSNASAKEGYGDFTNVTLPLSTGDNAISLTAGGNYSEHWAVWLDTNSNGTFELSEKLVSGLAGKDTVQGNLVIDNSLIGLTTRMRVVMKYSGAPTTACGSLGDGEAEDYTVTVTANDNVAPTADANGDYNALVNNAISFSSLGSKDTDGTIVNYLWDFGDGAQSTTANPVHTYSTSGSFTAQLTVTDNDGASHTDSATVVIDPIDLDLENACLTKSPITGGGLTAGTAACLGNSSTIWLSLGEASTHQSVKITTGHGQGNLDVLYKNGGWPNSGDYDGQALGNGSTSTCMSLPAGSDYWSYLKITGGATGATILVEYDSAGCQ